MHRFIIFILAFNAIALEIAADSLKKDPKELLDSQIAMLDDLIEMTTQTLQNEQKLKSLILQYQQIQEEYIKNPKDKEQIVKMVRMADQILRKMEEAHLITQFDPDFISELAFFSKIANKKGIPKP